MRVAGIGFRKSASLASLRDALDRAIGDGLPVQAIATEANKSNAPAFQELATAMSVPCIKINASEIAKIQTITQSVRVQNRFGTGSLAEAAALAGAGSHARLVTLRVTSNDHMATAAIADNATAYNEGTDT